ncbi:MAG: hypothetical protein QOD00_1462 [Blastocatellia bacterium]|nr:hypothetical protein [Blastocatellia bacterium]
MLFVSYLLKRSPVRRRVGRQPYGLVKNMRRHSIGMRNVEHIHPGAYRLVLMIVPVDGTADGARDKEAGDGEG